MGSTKLRFLDYMTMAQGGDKVFNLTHQPLLPPANTPSRVETECDGTRDRNQIWSSSETDESIYIGGGVSSVGCWQPRCAHQR